MFDSCSTVTVAFLVYLSNLLPLLLQSLLLITVLFIETNDERNCKACNTSEETMRENGDKGNT